MGIIVQPDDKKYMSFEQKIHVRNWRLVQVLPELKLAITLSNLSEFTVHGLNFDQLNHINENKWTVERNFRFTRNRVFCKVCRGKGVVDWIQKVVGSEDERSRTALIPVRWRYWRNTTTMTQFDPSDVEINIPDEVYGSQPNIKHGQELCPTCKGTGIHKVSTWRVI